MQTNKTILITGCSSGIGLAAAHTLYQRGYQVFAATRKSADKDRLSALGLNSIILDMSDTNSIKAGLETVLSQTQGSLFAVFNNAGFGQFGAVEDLSRAALQAQFETNVFGLQELTNLIVPVMRRQGYGRIVNMSSVLGLMSLPYRGAYCASKFALEALSDSLRLELRGAGIYVSLIEPGPIATDFRKNTRLVYEQHIVSEQSPHKLLYDKMLSDFEKKKGISRFTLPPSAVVDQLLHALESHSPKPRYYVTKPTYLLSIAKRLLPSRWLDALVARMPL